MCRATLTGPRKPSVNQEPSLPVHYAGRGRAASCFSHPHEKRPATGAGLVILAGGARTARAGKTELALTWGTVTLVIAPEEHPLPVGLGSRRAARLRKSTWVHATPLTEALHVPLHLERSCRADPESAAASRTDVRAPDLSARDTLDRRRLCWFGAAVRDGGRESRAATSIRELLAAAPSMPASPSVILQCLLCACLAQMRHRFPSGIARFRRALVGCWRCP